MLQIGELLYPDIHVFVPQEKLDMKFPYILPATMFDKLILNLDNLNHTLTVYIPDGEQTIRNLKVWDEGGKLYIIINNKLVKDGNGDDLAIGYNDSKETQQDCDKTILERDDEIDLDER